MEQNKLTENQKRITPTQARLLEALKKNPKTSICKLSVELEITERNLRYQVKILKLMGLLKRIGPNHKDGYWEVLKQNLEHDD